MIRFWAKHVAIRLFQGGVLLVYYVLCPRGTVRRMP